MNGGKRRTGAGWLVAIAACGLATGCTMTAGTATPEATKSTSEALIATDPTPPYWFPYGDVLPSGPELTDCRTYAAETWLAYPTRDATGDDPYQTAYTHGHMYGVCSTEDFYCKHQQDLWSIPNANGFKYLVARLQLVANSRSPAGPKGQQWFLQGIQRVDKTYWMVPWNKQGDGGTNSEPAPWTIIDQNSHPPYGSDARSADWLQLWNVAYTYGPGTNGAGQPVVVTEAGGSLRGSAERRPDDWPPSRT
jgi:hypothetical protein